MKKLLTIAAATTLLGAGVFAGPAHAGRPNCWFQMQPGAQSLDPVACRVAERSNSNGHRVYDVVENDGYKRTVVLWDNARAEVLVEGKNLKASWEVDQDGDVFLSMDSGGKWAFRAKNISAVSSGRPAPRPQPPAARAPQPAAPTYQVRQQQRQIIVQPVINVPTQIIQ